MNGDENVEEGEIEETTPPTLVSLTNSSNSSVPGGGVMDDNSDHNSQIRENNRYAQEYQSSNWSGDYQDRRAPKSEYSDLRGPADGARNPNTPALLLSNQPPRQYPRQAFPNPRDRGPPPRGVRPTNFPDKRPFNSPRMNPPRTPYGPSWNSGKPNEYTDYQRNSPSYYGPTPGQQQQPPRFAPSNALPNNPPPVPPVSEPVTPVALNTKCVGPTIPPSSSISSNISMKVITEDDSTKPKPLPLIHVVSDPNLTIEPSKLVAPKLPPPVPSGNRGVYPRPAIFQPSHSSPTKMNITRLIDQVSAPTMTPPTQLPLGVLQEEPPVANLPPPPPLDGPTESTESVSSRSRPRVVWGQGLRRKSSGPIDLESTTPNAASKPETDAPISETETFQNEPAPEKFLDLEDEGNLPSTEVEVADAVVPGPVEQINSSSDPVKKEPSVEGALKISVPDQPSQVQKPIESPRSKGKPGRPSLQDESKSVKKVDKKLKKNEPKPEVSRRKSFDETRDSDSDNKPEEGKKRRTLSRDNLGDSDKESVEGEAPRKKRGRPPAGSTKTGGSTPLADDVEKEPNQPKSVRVKNARNRVGRGKADAESAPLNIMPPPPVKRRSRSFGSFERDSLGGLFSSVSDLRNAYYALQGMVRIQVGMRGVGGFNKEDLMSLNQMLQNPQSVVNLPIPYTSEIVMCLEIIEAKSYQYGDAMVAIQLLKRDIEEMSKRGNSTPQAISESPPESSRNDDSRLSTSTHHPMGLVKKSAIKSEANKKAQMNLWPEPLVQQFLVENSKRVAAADICAHVHFPPSLPNAGNIYDVESLVQRGKRDLERNRSAVFAEVRRRKLARTQAWEILADRYVAVKHRWDHYHEKHAAPAEEEVLGPRLRAMSTMRNILGPRAPSRLSTMRASSDMLLQDQDKILQQLAMKELMARRLALGVCPIPDMLSPWQNSDSSVAPKPPSWPPKDIYLPDIKAEEKYTCSSEEFPKSVADPPVIIDINGCRLTTDGRRPHCAIQPTSQRCALNCNCSLQVDKEERKFHPWSDMEKCIFLDKFMQFPKNFSKIAAFLTNRTTKDCVKFYYDSKTTIPYKSLLREFDNRKRHLRNSWTHSCAAAVSVGGLLYPPDADEKEHIAELPPDDVTYSTFCSHPMHMATALGFDGDEDSEKGTYRKKQMTYLQHRPPRERTQILAARKDIKRECLKVYEQNGMASPPYFPETENGSKFKMFSYPADFRHMNEMSEYYGGYGQNDDNWTQQEGMNTRKKSGTGNNTKDTVNMKDADRGRGRGRRGRRPNTLARGTGRSAQEAPPEPCCDNNLSPTSRGRGRSVGRGRGGQRGRGRGRGKGDEDTGQRFFNEKDEDEAFEGNDPNDESFDREYEGADEGDDDDVEYDQREEEIDILPSQLSDDREIVHEVVSSIINSVSVTDFAVETLGKTPLEDVKEEEVDDLAAEMQVLPVTTPSDQFNRLISESPSSPEPTEEVSHQFDIEGINDAKRKFCEIEELGTVVGEEQTPLKCMKMDSDNSPNNNIE